MRFAVGLMLGVVMPMAAAAQDKPVWEPTARVAASYVDDRTGSLDRSGFALTRGEFGTRVTDEGWCLAASGEFVRSAQPGSLMGIAGNSLFLRPRELRVTSEQTAGDWFWRVSGGLLRSELRESGENDPLAIVERDILERLVGDDPADIGVAASVGWKGVANLGVAVRNGEGARDVERNEERNLSTTMEVRPLGAEGLGGWLPVLEGAVTVGTAGVASQETVRREVALVIAHRAFRVSARYGEADGASPSEEAEIGWMRVTGETSPLAAGLSALALWEVARPDRKVEGSARRVGLGVRWSPERAMLGQTVMVWGERDATDDSVAPVPGIAAAATGFRFLANLSMALPASGKTAFP